MLSKPPSYAACQEQVPCRIDRVRQAAVPTSRMGCERGRSVRWSRAVLTSQQRIVSTVPVRCRDSAGAVIGDGRSVVGPVPRVSLPIGRSPGAVRPAVLRYQPLRRPLGSRLRRPSPPVVQGKQPTAVGAFDATEAAGSPSHLIDGDAQSGSDLGDWSATAPPSWATR